MVWGAENVLGVGEKRFWGLAEKAFSDWLKKCFGGLKTFWGWVKTFWGVGDRENELGLADHENVRELGEKRRRADWETFSGGVGKRFVGRLKSVLGAENVLGFTAEVSNRLIEYIATSIFSS